MPAFSFVTEYIPAGNAQPCLRRASESR